MQIHAVVLRLVAAATMLSAALPVLSGQLLAVSTGYVAVRPCIADLLARALHIDAVVIALPASMQASTPPSCLNPVAHVLQQPQAPVSLRHCYA